MYEKKRNHYDFTLFCISFVKTFYQIIRHSISHELGYNFYSYFHKMINNNLDKYNCFQ